MKKETVTQHFKLLKRILEENNLRDKPSVICNMDGTGIHINYKPRNVIAEKGSKADTVLTAAEKGATITVITFCNAEGAFIPPACIFKRKNLHFMDGMLP